MKAFRLASILGLLALALGLSSSACGGGGGGGGGGTPPTQPVPGITVTSSSATAPAIRIGAGAATTATRLALEVRADQIDAIFGISFDLLYPTAQLKYEGVEEGTFLSQSSTVTTTFAIVEISPGHLVVGLSRLGSVGAVGGSGVLLTFDFSTPAGGTGSFTFDDNEAFAPDGTVLDAVSWGAGTVTVIP